MAVVAVDEFFLSVRHFCIPSRTLALKGASALVVLPLESEGEQWHRQKVYKSAVHPFKVMVIDFSKPFYHQAHQFLSQIGVWWM